MTKPSPRLILGSASPQRVALLAQIGIKPDVIQGADIDETPRKGELPRAYCLRIAQEKNAALAEQFPNDFLITGDTIGAAGRRILGKPNDRGEAEKMLSLLSGRAHRIYTAVVVRAPDRRVAHRLQDNRVRIKRMSDPELQKLLDAGEWQNRSGSYTLQGMMAQYIVSIQGSPSGIIGLPLHETAQLLKGLGYAPLL